MPSIAVTQSPRVYRVGVIHVGGLSVGSVEGLREGLRELGWEDGKHYVLIVRDAKGDLKVAEAAARELERDNVDLLYTFSATVTLTAKRGTTRLPIVFYAGTDPGIIALVESFPVEQLARPHFALNLKTAKELGLTIPTAVLVQADEVIR